jgi:hypothetical protein
MFNLLRQWPTVALLLLGMSAVHAETLVSPTALPSTERGMFMSNGRYFVAGKSGVHEVKRAADNSANCKLDSASGFTLCQLVAPPFEGDTCDFSGMTTDNTYLYAACTVWADSASALSALNPPKRAVLFRIKPAANSTAAEVKTKNFASQRWYNGMTMLDSSTILMTPSSLLGSDSAVVKLKITNTSTLAHTVTEWLSGSVLYLIPNGIQVSDGYLYYVGGQSLYRIKITSTGSAGVPFLIYQTPTTSVLDDLNISGDWVSVAEIGIVNGLGLNSITVVNKTGLVTPYRILTGMTQVSSLVRDPGTFGATGSYVATSYYQGGILRYYP